MSAPLVPPTWHFEIGDGPLVACAIHNGHAVRPEVEALLGLSDAERRYEEDPYTGDWTTIAPTRFIGQRSRFEVDLNRPRSSAIYLQPDDAWGLKVWRTAPPAEVVNRSLAEYDAFYRELRQVLQNKAKNFGRVVVFDLHTYNHRRAGPAEPPADSITNPEINIGTRSLDRRRWSNIVDRAISELRDVEHVGRSFDVRENVKFGGGELAKWAHRTFPATVCVLAIEVKKIFMNEWSDERDNAVFHAVHKALENSAAGVLDVLRH